MKLIQYGNISITHRSESKSARKCDIIRLVREVDYEKIKGNDLDIVGVCYFNSTETIEVSWAITEGGDVDTLEYDGKQYKTIEAIKGHCENQWREIMAVRST